MDILHAIILGLVQGLTEFIPVSSSGHLVLLQEAFGISGKGLTFDVALHLGTLLALIIFFYKDIVLLVQGLFNKNEYSRLAWLIAAATVPAVIAGVLLKDLAESSFRSPLLVSCNLILVAFLMIWAERVAKRRKSQSTLHEVSWKQAISMGLAQALALIPGVSRSGSTITAGLFVGLERVAATRFSFLLAIPITFGAIIKVAMDAGLSSLNQDAGLFAIGIFTALISGLFAIKFLLKYLVNNSLAIFAYYRIVLGTGVLLMLAVR